MTVAQYQKQEVLVFQLLPELSDPSYSEIVAAALSRTYYGSQGNGDIPHLSRTKRLPSRFYVH